MRGDGSFVGGDVSVEVEGVVAADLPEQLTFLVVNVKSEDLVRVEVSGHGPVEGVTDDLRRHSDQKQAPTCHPACRIPWELTGKSHHGRQML